MQNFSRDQIATAISILFHLVGLFGILLFKSDLVIHLTPVNLLLSFALLAWTQKQKNIPFFIFIISIFSIGFFSEVIGVNTNLLFGNYQYSDVLGPKWKAVPWMIGINWFIIIYCCGVSIQTLMKKILEPAPDDRQLSSNVKALSLIVDGATLAVIFDWLIEPVAVKLKFWQWANDSIPLYNYLCWFIISLLMLTIFHYCRFDKRNKFAVNLLLIQALFFLLLRSFL